MPACWTRPIGVALTAALLSTVGCVRPWERGALAHRSLDATQLCEQASEDFKGHTFDIREGATGGLGRPGGGCGCN